MRCSNSVISIFLIAVLLLPIQLNAEALELHVLSEEQAEELLSFSLELEAALITDNSVDIIAHASTLEACLGQCNDAFFGWKPEWLRVRLVNTCVRLCLHRRSNTSSSNTEMDQLIFHNGSSGDPYEEPGFLER